MSSANIGWLFYKDYFKGIDYKDLENSKNEIIIKEKVLNIINQKPEIEESEVLGSTHFTAKTTYPGLLLGSGNSHTLPGIKGQATLGFHFDYTSGLPIIQGSSIKGVLRSAFKHWEYIEDLLLNDSKLNSESSIKDLETEIFDTNDIFFDATLLHSNEKILGDDFITPHADELKEPNPIRFIKVLPNLSFRFDFELSDGLISKSEKVELFKAILEDLGIGAKTNVGYGKFDSFLPYKTKEEIIKEKKEEDKIQKRKEEDEKAADLKRKEEKTQKAENGISKLLECKTLAEGFKLLKDSFVTKPKPTPEQKEIIQQFYNKQSKLSRSDEKVFKKYLK